MPEAQPLSSDRLADRPGAWVDLGLTLPIFLVYHLAVVFLGVQNATDMVTGALMSLSAGDKTKYLLATLCIGVIFAGTFALLGRGQAFRPRKFVQILVEGAVYAVVMALAANAVASGLFASVAGNIKDEGRFVGFIMSLGAGFYEELTFRVLLFGLGAKILVWFFGRQRVELAGTSVTTSGFTFRSLLVMSAWAIACAVIFSGVHYVGALADSFQLTSFTFRAVLGLILTLIFVTRGFAAAVWTHTIYDVWVLVFR
ncbi:MAG TPA: CPBP family glutamic-type intramembrane protease [Labilithrix sp.]|jgi:hypothetical protein|nr:CPBP family glutamic-type intramembrane protease [Labilithrix sp.]